MSADNLSHSRTITGPWLAAKTPTSSAMRRPAGIGVLASYLPQELRFGHADVTEVEPQQIGVGQPGQCGDVASPHRSLDLRLQAIAVHDALGIGGETPADLGLLHLEEEAAQPVVAHRDDLHEGDRA